MHEKFLDNATTILIVDDDKHVLNTVKMLLQEEGYSTIACGNPYDAVEVLRESGSDIVLSDIKMPGMTGIDLMDEIHEVMPGIPVILFTAYADLDTAISAIKKDAFDFIIKPFDPEVLIKSIGKAVIFQKYVRLEKEYKVMLEEEVSEKTKELCKTVEELRVAKDRAMEASRLKSEFLANMSHEIRTPLNGIMGLTDLLLNMELGTKAKGYLELMAQSASSLTILLNNILEISNLESGRSVTNQTKFNLCDVILDLKLKYLEKATQKGLSFIQTMDEDVPCWVIGSALRLRQVLSLLLDNAHKFTERGMVTLAVSVKEAYGDTVNLLFSVVDTGAGISREKMPSIFESFWQADGSFTREYGGAGLGLAIVDRVSKIMGGDIKVQSCVGSGSAFNFTAKFKIAD